MSKWKYFFEFTGANPKKQILFKFFLSIFLACALLKFRFYYQSWSKLPRNSGPSQSSENKTPGHNVSQSHVSTFQPKTILNSKFDFKIFKRFIHFIFDINIWLYVWTGMNYLDCIAGQKNCFDYLRAQTDMFVAVQRVFLLIMLKAQN